MSQIINGKAILKKQLTLTKNKAFHELIENMDYRENGSKIYKYINNDEKVKH